MARIGPEAPQRIRAQAAVTAGSALRQLHRYRDAAAAERLALRTGCERAHLLIGLAADAVGLGDARACARRIGDAVEALPPRDQRVRIRLDWVRCEHALLHDRGRQAAETARSALRRSRAAGFRRHEAKSLLFLGASLRAAGAPSWRRALEDARDLAVSCGARPIARVARAMLAEKAGR